MKTTDIALLFDYNFWANRRILAASAGMSQAQFLQPTGHSYGTLRGTLTHTLEAEYAWRTLIQQHTLAGFEEMTDDFFPTFDALAQRWDKEEQAMRAYLATLTDDDLTGFVRYATDEGEKRERVLWHCLVHLVNHGTQHRSEAAAILTGYGYSPGELDFTMFLNEQG